MYQKKHADGKDEHEWADEKPNVQVKISNEPVKSPSHSLNMIGGRNQIPPVLNLPQKSLYLRGLEGTQGLDLDVAQPRHA